MADAAEIARGLTKAQARGVLWFAANGPAALFNREAPTRVVRQRLIAAGLVHSIGKESGGGVFAFTLFDATDLGREVAAAIRSHPNDGGEG